MDEVQKFIAQNQHQFGYIMGEASRQWIAKDPVGALTVGDCNFVIQKHGQYHELLEKVERYEKVLKNISEMDEVGFNPEYVLKRYSEYARNALNGKFED
jgi:hypothetical protein